MITAITERLRVLIDTIEPTDLPQLSAELVRSLDLPPDLPEEMPIAAVAAATGVSAHTLHYYERIGLVEVARDAAVGGSMAPTRWARLRMSDMPSRDIQRYLDLVGRGESTVLDRLVLLSTHRQSILQRLHDLQAAIAVIDYKIATYGGDCALSTR